MRVLNDIWLTGESLWFPLGQPFLIVPADFLPFSEITGSKRAE